jgi:hypothetical protein
MWQKQLADVACTAGRSVPWHAVHAELFVPDAFTWAKPCTSPWQVPKQFREAVFPGAWQAAQPGGSSPVLWMTVTSVLAWQV